jgi:Flp pilus assembly pilin Flp
MSLIRDWWGSILAGMRQRQPGQGLAEYGLILTIVSIAAVVLIVSMGPKLASMFSSAAVSLK